MMEGKALAGIQRDGGMPARESQVPAALDRLSNALARLSDLAERVEMRLAPAMRPTQPTPPPGNRGIDKQVHEVKAPLAEAIDQLTMRVEGVEARLVDAISRVEV